MSRKLLYLLTVLCILLLISFNMAQAEGPEERLSASFFLPLSLQEIEEEAFSYTAAERVVFPKSLLRIGDKAFAGAWRLTDVYIPDTTQYISDSAFSITDDFTIHGIEGSYAMDWAEEHQVTFVVDDIWSAVIRNEGNPGIQGFCLERPARGINPIKIIKAHERGRDEGRSHRPQERPELNPIDYRFP